MDILSAFLGLALLGSELALAWRRRSARVADTSERDQGSLRLLWRVISLATAAGFLLSLFGVGPSLPQTTLWRWATLGVFGFGTVVRWWAIQHLGRFFTVDVAIATTHRLIDTGPYRWVRHPSYTGLMLQFTGLAFAFGNALALFVVLVPLFLALDHRMTVEERALGAAFGLAYRTYSSKTRRLIPLLY